MPSCSDQHGLPKLRQRFVCPLNTLKNTKELDLIEFAPIYSNPLSRRDTYLPRRGNKRGTSVVRNFAFPTFFNSSPPSILDEPQVPSIHGSMTIQPVQTCILLFITSFSIFLPRGLSEVLPKNIELEDVTIERLDESLDNLIDKSATFELLAEGFEWSEGPVWMLDDNGYLLFTDVTANRIYRWDEDKGIRFWIQPSGYTGTSPDRGRQGMMGANGLNINQAGQLLLCQHGDRRVALLASDNTFETVADRYRGKRFNSPNDLTVHSDGSIYFTDPPFGLRKQYSYKEYKLGYSVVFRIAPNGDVSLIAKQFDRPNGVTLSPDETILYVGNKNRNDAKILLFH